MINDGEQVDEEKHIYKGDKNLVDTIENDNNLLNALIDILTEHCILWEQGKAPKQTERFRDAKQCVVGINDIYGDFMDKMLEKNNDPNDRIGKNRLRELFLLTSTTQFLMYGQA